MTIDEWMTDWGVTVGVGGLMTLMIFIVWDLAKKYDAGKYGTFILYIALAMGIVGFSIKGIIQYLMEGGL